MLSVVIQLHLIHDSKYYIANGNAHHPTLSTQEPEGLQLELKLVLKCTSHEFRVRACDNTINQTPAKQQRFTKLFHVFVII